MFDLKDLEQNRKHYVQQNGRTPGMQIEQRWGPDFRQQTIMGMLPKVGTVLDLGAADGSLLIMLSEAKLLTRGWGADLWTDGIKWGQEYCNKHQLPISLQNKCVEDYNGDKADVVILGEILEHVIDPVRVLKVAKKYGDVVIITVPVKRPPFTQAEIDKLKVEPEEHIRDYTFELLAKHCSEAGLKIEKSIIVGVGWVNLVALAKEDKKLSIKEDIKTCPFPRFIYSSSPDRGLDTLLYLFQFIRREFPQATLHILYGFNNWSMAIDQRNNEAEKKWRDQIMKDMEQPGVHYYGRVDQNTVAKMYQSADIWFYPSKFTETFCITALEAQMSKTVCVCTDLAALQSTVGDRGILIQGDAYTKEYRERALQEVFSILKDDKRRKNMIDKAHEWAKQQTWDARASEMLNIFGYKT